MLKLVYKNLECYKFFTIKKFLYIFTLLLGYFSPNLVLIYAPKNISYKDSRTFSIASLIEHVHVQGSFKFLKLFYELFSFLFRVPNQICFGQGSALGFQRGRGRGNKGPKKHWHQAKKGTNTAVDIESVDMKELAQALEAPKDSAMENWQGSSKRQCHGKLNGPIGQWMVAVIICVTGMSWLQYINSLLYWKNCCLWLMNVCSVNIGWYTV